jgi:hypothetical protein
MESAEDDACLVAAYVLIRLVEKAAHIDAVTANRKVAAAKRKIIVKLERMECLFDGARIGRSVRAEGWREIFCT